MATLKEIRKRISSVQNTRKITRAMKLVAGARLKRAQDRILAARPYANKLDEIVSNLALHADPDDHALLEVRENPQSACILCITSDRGLCGGFNSSVLRKVESYALGLQETYEKVLIYIIGKKGYDYFSFREKVDHFFPEVFTNLEFDTAAEVGEALIKEFEEHQIDDVFIAFNVFKSAISQIATINQLLPVTTPDDQEADSAFEMIYEPGRDELLAQILPRYVNMQIYRALLESWASEQGARMTAMENATTNADDLIKSLTLQRNRARQAAITKELVEISTGVEVLKG